MVSIFVLLYGDHFQLANRCLGAMAAAVGDEADLRIGMNAVSEQTRNFVAAMVAAGSVPARNVYDSTDNVHKYPLMRRMFHDRENPVTHPYIMWFDDDSFVRPQPAGTWLPRVLAEFSASSPVAMLGEVWRYGLGGNQHLWVRDQPWYAGKPVPAGHKVKFVTGGWWTIRTEVIRKYDWPVPELDHRGGDVMLGELFRQQELGMKHFNHGVAINADAAGVSSRSPKRGYDSRPIGYSYIPGAVSVPIMPLRSRQHRLYYDL